MGLQLTDLAFLILTINKYLPVVYLHLLTFIVDSEQGEDDYVVRFIVNVASNVNLRFNILT